MVTRGVLAVVLALLAAAPSRAADDADLRAKINAAMGAVTSMEILFSTDRGTAGTATVLPGSGRLRLELDSGTSTMRIYEIDGYVYRSRDGGPWAKAKERPGTELFDFARSFEPTATLTRGPDVTESGVTYGTVKVERPSATGETTTLACSFDESTFRLHRCTNNGVTMTYGAYDDPKNAVELPPAAAAAPTAPEGR